MVILLLSVLFSLSAADLVERSIRYHDPNGAWATLDHTFKVLETRPDGTVRNVSVTIDTGEDRFIYEAAIGEDRIVKQLERGDCRASINGVSDISQELAEKYRTSCDQIEWHRNYYLYLLGMPMKLRDPGTIIDSAVSQTVVEGERLLQIRVRYDDEVGSDIWYYYVDPETSALRAARFYHDESANDGELILFQDEVETGGMILPKHRRWYMNSDGRHIGTDSILEDPRED